MRLEDGSFAPLDYKFALWKDKVYETYKQQLYCYAVLIEENYGAPVNKGFLIYTRSHHKLIKIDITSSNKEIIQKSMLEMLEIIQGNKYPKATKYKKRCLNCTYRNICIK